MLCAGDLASSEWWERQDLVPPEPSPPENLQSVLADVFLDQHQQNPFPASQPLPNLHLPKTAPPHSLLVRQACLLSLYFDFPCSEAYLTILRGLACSQSCILACVCVPTAKLNAMSYQQGFCWYASYTGGMRLAVFGRCMRTIRAKAHFVYCHLYQSSVQLAR